MFIMLELKDLSTKSNEINCMMIALVTNEKSPFQENKAHIFITKYVQIEIFKNSDWSMFLGKSS